MTDNPLLLVAAPSPATAFQGAQEGRLTLFHHGRRLTVEVVQSAPARRGQGTDSLLIDTRGRYYVRRELPCGRTLLHRLSTLATILWELAANDQQRLRQAACALFSQVPEPFALDTYAQALVRAELRRQPEEDARDLVNAGVYFLLGNEDADSASCREQARERRLGLARCHFPR